MEFDEIKKKIVNENKFNDFQKKFVYILDYVWLI